MSIRLQILRQCRNEYYLQWDQEHGALCSKHHSLRIQYCEIPYRRILKYMCKSANNKMALKIRLTVNSPSGKGNMRLKFRFGKLQTIYLHHNFEQAHSKFERHTNFIYVIIFIFWGTLIIASEQSWKALIPIHSIIVLSSNPKIIIK